MQIIPYRQAHHQELPVTIDRNARPTGETDWAYVDSMTDEEALQNARDDPDNPPVRGLPGGHAETRLPTSVAPPTSGDVAEGIRRGVRVSSPQPTAVGTGTLDAGEDDPVVLPRYRS